jgi:hypothetical protein
MNLRTLTSAPARALRARSVGAHRPPAAGRRPAVYLAVAAAGAVLFSVTAGTEPAADAAQLDSASVAEQLGVSAQAEPLAAGDVVAPLEQLAASRSERDAERTAAAAAQATADQAEQERLAAEAAAAQAAAEEAARAAEAEAARAAEAQAAAVAPGGSYQDYAVGQLGGNGGEFGCLENLWGKESGWNPNAQNPSSTAYGIPQFLDSTWAGTGIAKTSDGYRQIDAGLIYINDRYGSPCGAWSHSTSTGWY